jgi:hypothetical protein
LSTGRFKRSEKIREYEDREWNKHDAIEIYFDFWRVVGKDPSACWKAVKRGAEVFEALISYAPDFLLDHLATIGASVDQQTAQLIMSVISHEFGRTDLLSLPKWCADRRKEYEEVDCIECQPKGSVTLQRTAKGTSSAASGGKSRSAKRTGECNERYKQRHNL